VFDVSNAILGVVQDGKVVPNTPLPEGTVVHILVAESTTMPLDLQEEFDEWAAGSAEALARVEDLAEAGRDQG
jgi:hypothetical protein